MLTTACNRRFTTSFPSNHELLYQTSDSCWREEGKCQKRWKGQEKIMVVLRENTSGSEGSRACFHHVIWISCPWPQGHQGSSACVVGGNIEEALAIVNVKEGVHNPYSDNHGMEEVTGSSWKRSRSLDDCLGKELYGSRTWTSWRDVFGLGMSISNRPKSQ